MKLYLLLFLLVFTSCMKLPEGVKESLRFAGNNKGELKKVLRHYSRKPEDSLKYQAACFLIDNMKWHGNQTTINFSHSLVPLWVHKANSLFMTIAQKAKFDQNEIKKQIKRAAKAFQDSIQNVQWGSTFIQPIQLGDLENISSEFLISHINHAFKCWEESAFARHLSYEEFCEYLLPYRSLNMNSFIINGQKIYDQTKSYVLGSPSLTLKQIIGKYNFYLGQIRTLLGPKPCETPLGVYEMFFDEKLGCIEQCDLECSVLRAWGVPAMVDINRGNREFIGEHHHCVIIDSNKQLHPFHAESNLPQGKSWGYRADIKLNTYRSVFGAQKDSPCFLIKETEQLPADFQTPCLKEVTSYIKKVYPFTLPLPQKTSNRLVWLYTYANHTTGVKAITWGTVDTTGRKAEFKNVVPDMLYFPATISSTGEPIFYQTPIYVTTLPKEKICTFYFLDHYTDSTRNNKINLYLTRKFPYKESMQKLAHEMIGGKFYGTNRKDEKDRKELFTITTAPGPYLNEYRLNNKKAWKYYIYQAPEKTRANIAILEFLTDVNKGYVGKQKPQALEIFRPEDKNINSNKYIKISAKPGSIDKEAEYDGDMQTSSGKKKIIFEADTPVVVTCIRMAPKNADNIIKPKEDYELMAWDKGWKTSQRKYSHFNYLEFDSLSPKKLYWLRNHSRGKEEVPFLIKNGQAAFIYYDILQAPDREAIYKTNNENWICTASSEEPDNGPYEPGYARFAIDNDYSTWWHSQYTGKEFNYPHWIKIDTKSITFAEGIFIKPRGRDVPKHIKIEISIDDEHWTPAGNYTLYNDNSEQRFNLKDTLKFRYFRITFLDGHNSRPYTSIAEIGLFNNIY